jgi:hypothetical protein
MKTCPSCCADDLPDAATHCKHCGRRIKPLHLWAVIPLSLFILLMCYAFSVRLILPAFAHAEAREEAHRLIDQAKYFCTPNAPKSVVEALSTDIKDKIDKLDLDDPDKRSFEVLFDNQLELLGCGNIARNQLKPKRHR